MYVFLVKFFKIEDKMPSWGQFSDCHLKYPESHSQLVFVTVLRGNCCKKYWPVWKANTFGKEWGLEFGTKYGYL